MLQTFTFTGTGRQIDAKGTFFRYESGSAAGDDTAIRVTVDGNDLGSYVPGDSVRLPVEVKRWNIVPASAACVGTVRIGLGSVESTRLVGTVETVDGARARSLANISGIGPAASAAVAGQFSHVQLWNTPGSGLNLFVRKVLIASVAPNGFYLRHHNAPLTTMLGNPISKLLSYGSFASFELRAQSNAALLGSGVMTSLNPANTSFPYEFNEPLVVPSGYGLMLVGGAANSDINAVFDFFYAAAV